MGSASVALVTETEDTTNKRTTVTSASVSQSIGAGASIYLDVVTTQDMQHHLIQVQT